MTNPKNTRREDPRTVSQLDTVHTTLREVRFFIRNFESVEEVIQYLDQSADNVRHSIAKKVYGR